jgi:hypothetical protein
MALVGIPYQRDLVAFWVLVGLLCFSTSDLRGYARGVIFDWLPFVTVLIAYDSLRGTAGHLFGVNYRPQIQVDAFLFGGTNPTVALQRWLWHGHVTCYDVVAWCVYLSHFFATPLLAAVLWKRDRTRFRSYAVRVVVLSLASVATFALYPAAPPWMASQAHLIGPVTRIIPAVFSSLHVHSAGSLIEHGYQYANSVAAVPSLHAAFALLIAITLWPHCHRWLRPILVAYPLAMAFTLIYTGEHYFFDIALGWTYTVATLLVMSMVKHRSLLPAGVAASRRRQSAEPLGPGDRRDPDVPVVTP